MKLLFILLLTQLVASMPLFSQYPSDIIFTSQEAINDFKTTYPGCTVINGQVEIRGNEIRSLSGLNEIVSIGNLIISEAENLTTLTD